MKSVRPHCGKSKNQSETMRAIKDKVHAINNLRTDDLVYGFGQKAMCGIDGYVNTSPIGLTRSNVQNNRKCKKCLRKLRVLA